MTDVTMYNAVTYDGVDAYVIKTLGQNEDDVRATFKNTDMEVLKIDRLYTWSDLDEHIAGAMQNKWELGDGNIDIKLAIKRYIELKTGVDFSKSGLFN
jgi:hypothetical protein